MTATYRMEERDEPLIPWTALFIMELQQTIKSGTQTLPWGEPTREAELDRAWLASTAGSRRFPVLVYDPAEIELALFDGAPQGHPQLTFLGLNSDFCLHMAEPEITTRIHSLCGQQHKDVEEYRACALRIIDSAWELARQKWSLGHDMGRILDLTLEDLRERAKRRKQGVLF